MDSDSPQQLNYVADAVVIDLAANAIRLRVPEFPTGAEAHHEATLDVGANGRLIGVEVGERYIQVMGQPEALDPHMRSADVRIGISPDTPPYISIPRRGDGYEITYPSGNECWQMKSVGGQLIQVCATIEAAPGALSGAHEFRRSAVRHRPGSAPE
jgi:hypothetical protein